MSRRSYFLTLSLVWFAGTAAPALAQERYFVMVFGAQRSIATPQYTHSWAIFVRTCGPDLADAPLETLTISWLSARKVVDIKRLSPEPGANLDNDTTMTWCCANRMHTSMWGPYEITACLWERAKRRVERLESGNVEYRALDSGRPYDGHCNCIHAIAHPELTGKIREAFVTALAWGENASRLIALALRDQMIEPDKTYPVLADRILGDWPVERHGMGRYPNALPRARRFNR